MARRTGIRTRHSRSCTTRTAARCNCEPTYEAWVYSKRDGKKIRRSFPTQAAARRAGAPTRMKAVKDKRLRAPSSRTLRQEVDEWLAGAREGRILNKREQPYKPAVHPQLRARAPAAGAARRSATASSPTSTSPTCSS